MVPLSRSSVLNRPPLIETLVSEIAQALPNDLKRVGIDLRSNLRAVVEAALDDLDVVTREEFDTQKAVGENATAP